jgi:hypothetical protein
VQTVVRPVVQAERVIVRAGRVDYRCEFVAVINKYLCGACKRFCFSTVYVDQKCPCGARITRIARTEVDTDA